MAFKCDWKKCHESFRFKRCLRTHIREVHRSYLCDVKGCKTVCKSEQFLRRHIKEQHSRKLKRKFKCDQEGCHKSFKKNQYLRKHIWGCHRTERYPCKIKGCTNVYKRKQCLLVHIEAKHSGKLKKTFKCNREECSKLFSCKAYLTSHICKVHSGKLFKCASIGCDKVYTQKSSLVYHLKQKHLKQHKVAHSKPEFPCPNKRCSKVYTSKFGLKYHIGTNKHKYSSESLQRKNSVTTTTKSAIEHPNDLNEPKQSSIQSAARLAQKEQIFKCSFPLCELTFNHPASLTRHERLKHSAEFIFSCNRCNKSFVQQRDLVRHLDRHEPMEMQRGKERWTPKTWNKLGIVLVNFGRPALRQLNQSEPIDVDDDDETVLGAQIAPNGTESNSIDLTGLHSIPSSRGTLLKNSLDVDQTKHQPSQIEQIDEAAENVVETSLASNGTESIAIDSVMQSQDSIFSTGSHTQLTIASSSGTLSPDSLDIDQIQQPTDQIEHRPNHISNQAIYAQQPDRTYKCAWRQCVQLFPDIKQFQDHLVDRHLRGCRAIASNGRDCQCSWNDCDRLFEALKPLQQHIRLNHVWDQI